MSAAFAEYFRHFPERLKEKQVRFFWSAREWHPLIHMMWVAGTTSNGEGLIVYPDGTKTFYQRPVRDSG